MINKQRLIDDQRDGQTESQTDRRTVNVVDGQSETQAERQKVRGQTDRLADGGRVRGQK